MAIGSISAASLAQNVLTSSNITQTQQAWQQVQTSLAAGDLSGAKTAFATVQQLNQNLSNAGGAAPSTQLSTDMTALGSALTSGDLSTAQSAMATVQNDLKNAPSPALSSALQSASQSEQLVDGFLSTMSSSSSSAGSDDAMNAALESAYGTGSALNVYA